MTDEVLKLLRPAIRELTAYTSARSTHALALRDLVFMDANEATWTLGQKESVAHLNRYPDPQPKRLLSCLKELYEVEEDMLMVGRGTDEALDVLIRAFAEARQDNIVTVGPTYGLYETLARIQGVDVKEVPLDQNFDLDPEKVLGALTAKSKLIFLCSPNNPTGNALSLDRVASVIRESLGRAVVVVDEAYVEFSSTPSFTTQIRNHPNLVVLRTLSKAWGLAGARCGSAIAQPELIQVLQKVRAPYPLSTPTVEAVLQAMNKNGQQEVQAQICALRERREALKADLLRLPIVSHVYPSDSNFLLLKTQDPKRVMDCCRQQGIIIRDRSQHPMLAGCVRITVGRPEENQRLLEALQNEVGQ